MCFSHSRHNEDSIKWSKDGKDSQRREATWSYDVILDHKRQADHDWNCPQIMDVSIHGFDAIHIYTDQVNKFSSCGSCSCICWTFQCLGSKGKKKLKFCTIWVRAETHCLGTFSSMFIMNQAILNSFQEAGNNLIKINSSCWH